MCLDDFIGDCQKDRSVESYADIDGKVKDRMDSNVPEIMGPRDE
jgi:hypothetical protein